jgi:hypothetical protein
MRAADRDTVDAFEHAVAAIPHIRQAQRLFGDPDYLLRVISADLPAFQELYDNRLATLPGVQRLSFTLVMKSVVENRPLPLRITHNGRTQQGPLTGQSGDDPTDPRNPLRLAFCSKVSVVRRNPMYPEAYSQSRAFEKGIDVAIAVDMIRMGLGDELDVR